MKRKASAAQLVRRMAKELQRFRREEERIALRLANLARSSAYEFTVDEAARVLGCSRAELDGLIRTGSVGAIGGRPKRRPYLVGQRGKVSPIRQVPRSELRRVLEEKQSTLCQSLGWRFQRIVCPDYRPIPPRWRCYFSTKEVANKWGISPRRVVNLIKDGPLVGRQQGHGWRITVQELEEFKKLHGELISRGPRAA